MGIFIKKIKGPIFNEGWQVKYSVRMDADDLETIESAEVIDGYFGKNLKINLKAGGNWRKKISPRVDVSRLPIGTQVPLTSISLCTLSKPGEDDIQNFEIDGYLLPEYETDEHVIDRIPQCKTEIKATKTASSSQLDECSKGQTPLMSGVHEVYVDDAPQALSPNHTQSATSQDVKSMKKWFIVAGFAIIVAIVLIYVLVKGASNPTRDGAQDTKAINKESIINSNKPNENINSNQKEINVNNSKAITKVKKRDVTVDVEKGKEDAIAAKDAVKDAANAAVEKGKEIANAAIQKGANAVNSALNKKNVTYVAVEKGKEDAIAAKDAVKDAANAAVEKGKEVANAAIQKGADAVNTALNKK